MLKKELINQIEDWCNSQASIGYTILFEQLLDLDSDRSPKFKKHKEITIPELIIFILVHNIPIMIPPRITKRNIARGYITKADIDRHNKNYAKTH